MCARKEKVWWDNLNIWSHRDFAEHHEKHLTYREPNKKVIQQTDQTCQHVNIKVGLGSIQYIRQCSNNVKTLHSSSCSYGAEAHVAQYQGATWTTTFNLFSSSVSWEGSLSENKPLCLKHGLELNLFNFCLSLCTSLPSLPTFHLTPLFSRCKLFIPSLWSSLCFAVALSPVFLSFTLFDPRHIPRLLLGLVWVFSRASPGRASLVTAVRPSHNSLHCEG